MSPYDVIDGCPSTAAIAAYTKSLNDSVSQPSLGITVDYALTFNSEGHEFNPAQAQL